MRNLQVKRTYANYSVLRRVSSIIYAPEQCAESAQDKQGLIEQLLSKFSRSTRGRQQQSTPPKQLQAVIIIKFL